MALTLQQLMIRSMHDTMQIYHLWDQCMDVGPTKHSRSFGAKIS